MSYSFSNTHSYCSANIKTCLSEVSLLSAKSNQFSLQRPRKIGAKYTGSDFAPDEHIQPELAFDYEGKRDRWNGYDPDLHQKVYEEFEQLEEVSYLCYHGSSFVLTSNMAGYLVVVTVIIKL